MVSVGDRFGKLIIIERCETSEGKTKRTYWRCECECGNIKDVIQHNLTSNKTLSCGSTLCKILPKKYKVVKRYNKICPVCDTEFITKKSNGIYCSVRCNKKDYHNKNQEEVNHKNRIRYHRNPNRAKEYNNKNRDKRILLMRKWSVDNRERKKIYDLNKWIRLKNDETSYIRFKKNRKEYIKNRKERDTIYRLICKIRSVVGNGVRRRGYIKNGRTTEDILGCKITDFISYIESKFDDIMTWDNYGYYGWHLDHIIPISSAISEHDVIRLNHYTNFQPLWMRDNLSKGANKDARGDM